MNAVVEDEADYTDACFDRVMTTSEKRCEQRDFAPDTPEMKACRDAQEAAIDEFQLNTDNEEALYYNYPSAPRLNPATRNAMSQGGYECERVFQPDAEGKIQGLRRDQKSGDKAKEIGASLIRPFYEQYVEIPKSKRQRETKRCKSAVTAAVWKYHSCVKQKFRRPE